MFIIEDTYTKKQIYQIIDVPGPRQGGSWDTGYREYNGNFYIFANIGIPGRTGHDHPNHWDGGTLIWQAKTGTHSTQPLMRKLLSKDPAQVIHIFTRTVDTDPFTYEGKGLVEQSFDSSPVKIIWTFETPEGFTGPDTRLHGKLFWEGAMTTVKVNKYERDRTARRECIKHHTAVCQVCQIDFLKRYGQIGKGFIHVHHTVPLSTLKKGYLVDPINDLVPVCPNCHAMVHTRNPALTIDELRLLLIPS